MTMRAKRYQNSAALPYFYAPPLLNLLNPLNPLTSFAGSQWDDTPRWLTPNFSFLEKFNPHTLAFRSIIQIGDNLCV